MTADPLTMIEQAVTAATAELRHSLEASREGWNDTARRAFDAQYATELLRLADCAITDVAAVRSRLSGALRLLDDTHGY